MIQNVWFDENPEHRQEPEIMKNIFDSRLVHLFYIGHLL